MPEFRPAQYGPKIAEILGLAGDGQRLLGLVGGRCVSEPAREMVRAADLGPLVQCGLFLYLSCLDEAHQIAQEIKSPTGGYWHGMMHRQEPDFGNAAYWFRQKLGSNHRCCAYEFNHVAASAPMFADHARIGSLHQSQQGQCNQVGIIDLPDKRNHVGYEI